MTCFRRLLCLCSLATMAWAQTAKPVAPASSDRPAPPHAAAAKAADGSGVSATDAVITIPGLCEKAAGAASKASACQTVVTRAEFEHLMEAIAPSTSLANRKQLATQYGSALVMVHKAREMGLDRGPKFDELMRIARVRVITRVLSQALQEQSGKISADDIQKYYRDNGPAFEEAELQRIFIPRTRARPDSNDKSAPAELKKEQESEEAMKKEAEAIRSRAVAGEDFEKLQEEALAVASVQAKPPTKLGKIRRASLPPGQGEVFDLKAGEVSQLLSSPNGYLLYRVGEKDTLSLDKVREEISSTLGSQRFQDAMQAIQQSAMPQLNEKYFADTPPAAPPGVEPRKSSPESTAKPRGPNSK